MRQAGWEAKNFSVHKREHVKAENFLMSIRNLHLPNIAFWSFSIISSGAEIAGNFRNRIVYEF